MCKTVDSTWMVVESAEEKVNNRLARSNRNRASVRVNPPSVANHELYDHHFLVFYEAKRKISQIAALTYSLNSR